MVSEFQFLDRLRSRYDLKHLGDDCAVVPKDAQTDLLMTADMLVEDIDFRLNWTTPGFLGHKALAVSLSDVAAMGGVAKWAMLSLGIPEDLWKTDLLDGLYAGWFELARQFGVELVGGDVSRSPDKLIIDSIVGGEIPKGRAVQRSGAQPGDSIFVTGRLGAAAGGLKLLEAGTRYSPGTDHRDSQILLAQLKPEPQLKLGNLLQTTQIASSMIDLSDGLSSDLAHICRASGVGARIYQDRLPTEPTLAEHFPLDQCGRMALDGGEDFGLLFTAAGRIPEHIPATCIGEITEEKSIELIGSNGINTIEPKGFQHF